MVEKDYVMRIVHEMIRTLIRLIFQKDIDEGEEIIFSEEARQRNELLKKLIDAGEIEEAENRLLDEMENGRIPVGRGDGVEYNSFMGRNPVLYRI